MSSPGPAVPSIWPRPANPSALRRRPCSASAWPGRATSPRASPCIRTHSPRWGHPKRARYRRGSGWHADGGGWQTAEDHVRLAVAQTGDYELMIVSAALARAYLGAAHADAEGVLRSLAPLLDLSMAAIDEPGFWPWRDMYADALVSAGMLDE